MTRRDQGTPNPDKGQEIENQKEIDRMVKELKKDLPGCEIKIVKRETEVPGEFAVSITTPENWSNTDEDELEAEEIAEVKARAEKFIERFGGLIFNAYEPKTSERKYDPTDEAIHQEMIEDNFLDGDLGDSDKIFVIFKDGKPVGLLGKENDWTLPEVKEMKGKNGSYMDLVTVDPDQQGKGYGKELYKMAMAETDVLIGITNHPRTARSRLIAGQESGFTTFIAGHKNGVYGDRGTKREQKIISEIHGDVKDTCDDVEILAPESEQVEGYIVIDKSINPIAPAEAEEFELVDDPLSTTLKDGLKKTQEKCSKGNVADAIMISIRNE